MYIDHELYWGVQFSQKLLTAFFQVFFEKSYLFKLKEYLRMNDIGTSIT